MPSKTRRERLEELLGKGSFTVEQLARFLDTPVRNVVDDLEHVRQSAGDDFYMRPPECEACGFVFNKRRKIKRPSRCPECREERIIGPWFGKARRPG
jgi:predicted Zn-ribbon and HTH transcriptional regulator